ncbi:MAG: hypothetical protein KC589_10340 [Nanoarchaeota archaeon]|nr:hypothetical protein [Nanoarchaeota archaeon]
MLKNGSNFFTYINGEKVNFSTKDIISFRDKYKIIVDVLLNDDEYYEYLKIFKSKKEYECWISSDNERYGYGKYKLKIMRVLFNNEDLASMRLVFESDNIYDYVGKYKISI